MPTALPGLSAGKAAERSAFGVAQIPMGACVEIELIAELSQLSFRDGLIVASAEQAGASHLYTEDLNPGQSIVGVKIVDPLVAT